jgi:hypothetical protein
MEYTHRPDFDTVTVQPSGDDDPVTVLADCICKGDCTWTATVYVHDWTSPQRWQEQPRDKYGRTTYIP